MCTSNFITVRLLALIAAAALAACGGGSGDAGGESRVATFSKSYGGPLHDEAKVVVPTDDGGFMLFGSADGDDLGTPSSLQAGVGAPIGGDFWVQKLDANGNVEHSRTIGLRPPAAPGTTWKRARPTPDGGVVLAGTHALTRPLSRPDGATTVVTIDRDLAVTKLDAAGNVVWSVTHGSGAWLNYDYVERNGGAAAAHEWAEDVWPMADGGVLVAGTSIADLEDRLGIGFPCDDEELNRLVTGRHGFETCGGGQAGFRFIDAYSVVVMRLNADGSLRWVRRLTDNPYDSQGNARPDGLGVLVRSTADGGVVLSRTVGSDSALVHRLAADGAPLWRTVLFDVLAPVFNISPPPADLIQTDDPVDGPDADRYDGLRDDGFVLAAHRRIVKLAADGALQWTTEVDLAAAVPDRDFLKINGLTQHCDYGRPTRCDVVVVGGVQKRDSASSAGPSGFVAFLDHEDGGIRAEAYPPRDDLFGTRIASLLRVAAGATGRLQLLGIKDSRVALVELEAPPAEPVFLNERSGAIGERFNGTPDLRPDGSVLLLDPSGVVLKFLDAQARPQSELNIGSAPASEILRAAATIGPGRFILAGTRRAPGGQSGLIALRYDLDGDGGRIVWQRRLVADEGGDVLSAAPSGDGGIVLSLFIAAGDETDRSGLLVKLDGDGNRQWQATMPGPVTQLQAMPDGGFAALSFSFSDSLVRVTRLSATGSRQWQSSVSLGAEQGAVTALTASADGGLVLAGSFGPRLSLVRLAADGALLSASDVVLPADRGADTYFDHLQIRRAPDGGFVLAMTERGLFTRVSADGELLPLGQGNILVAKVDAAAAPLWARVYGGLLAEAVRDLAVRADGTIAVAGSSDSLGERREAWLLQLSPHGLISEAGCRALIGSIAPALIGTSERAVTVQAAGGDPSPVDDLPPFAETTAPLHAPHDFVTARQCLGDAGAGSGSAVPGPRRRLRVLQVGSRRGVVTSTPSAISCGSGLDICSADFAEGARVTLLADRDGFNAWRGDCDEGSGGTRLDCVIVLTRDRTVQVDFGAIAAPPPQLLSLAFAVQGPGIVRADGGLHCAEASPAADCSRDYAAGSLVDVSAEPSAGQIFLGWSSDAGDTVCASFGRQTALRITVDRNLRCFAQFGPPQERLLAISVFGGGVVRDDPSGATIDCREGGSIDDCQQIYASTETVALRALPDPGQRFAGWGGDCAASGIDPSITLLTAQGLFCSASFVATATGAALSVQVLNAAAGQTVESQPAGILCSADAASDCSEIFAAGTSVLLRASPQGFRSWQGCDEVLDISFCRVTMNQSRSVIANFNP